MLSLRFAAIAVVFAASAFAQEPTGFAMGWMPEFKATTTELMLLAQATPAEKFAWRPADGVRSISEVYVHIAVANKFFLMTCGAKPNMSKLRDAEKKITSKDDVIAFLKESIDEVEKAYPTLDRSKAVKFMKDDTTVEGVLVHMISHTNEHLGQSIAYARMNKIVPPWSN